MARPSFLTDEHIANAVAIGLRARGIDAATAAEAGQLGASDAALLAFARGYFDDETCRLEPIDNPFGPKVLPMSPE